MNVQLKIKMNQGADAIEHNPDAAAAYCKAYHQAFADIMELIQFDEKAAKQFAESRWPTDIFRTGELLQLISTETSKWQVAELRKKLEGSNG